jgi:hypothetical protein
MPVVVKRLSGTHTITAGTMTGCLSFFVRSSYLLCSTAFQTDERLGSNVAQLVRWAACNRERFFN